MLKFKDILKPGQKKHGDMLETKLKKEEDMVVKMGVMVEAENLEVTVKKGVMIDVVSAMKPLGIQMKASGIRTKTEERMYVSITNVLSPAVEAITSTAKAIMIGVSTPKPTGTHSKAVGSIPNQEGVIKMKQMIS